MYRAYSWQKPASFMNYEHETFNRRIASRLHILFLYVICIDILLGHLPKCNMESELVVGIKYSFIAINLFYLIHQWRQRRYLCLPSFLFEQCTATGTAHSDALWQSDTVLVAFDRNHKLIVTQPVFQLVQLMTWLVVVVWFSTNKQHSFSIVRWCFLTYLVEGTN